MKKRNIGFADQVIQEAIIEYGIEIFGEEKDFWRWMHCPMLALNDRKPIELSVEELLEELERFNNGTY